MEGQIIPMLLLVLFMGVAMLLGFRPMASADKADNDDESIDLLTTPWART